MLYFWVGGLDWPHLSDCGHNALTHIIIVKYNLSSLHK